MRVAFVFVSCARGSFPEGFVIIPDSRADVKDFAPVNSANRSAMIRAGAWGRRPPPPRYAVRHYGALVGVAPAPAGAGGSAALISVYVHALARSSSEAGSVTFCSWAARVFTHNDCFVVCWMSRPAMLAFPVSTCTTCCPASSPFCVSRAPAPRRRRTGRQRIVAEQGDLVLLRHAHHGIQPIHDRVRRADEESVDIVAHEGLRRVERFGGLGRGAVDQRQSKSAGDAAGFIVVALEFGSCGFQSRPTVLALGFTSLISFRPSSTEGRPARRSGSRGGPSGQPLLWRRRRGRRVWPRRDRPPR